MRPSKRKQSGFTIYETMLMLAVGALAASYMVQQYTRYNENLFVKGAADHSKTISDAASKYIQDNYSAITAVATPTVPAVITTSMLKNSNYLPSSISDKNGYGQDYQILAIEPAANKLETLIVTTGGQAIAELSLREIAKTIGGKGGYVSSSDTANANGSFGAWKVPLNRFSTAPGAGHLAIALFFDNGTVVNDYLNRSTVAGHPEANRMNTAIDLNGNNLNNVATVQATTATVSGTTTTGTADVQGETYTGGWFRSRSNGMVYSEKWGGGLYMEDPNWLRSYADKNIYTGGTMLATNLESYGRTKVGEYLEIKGIATKGTACTPWGLVGREASGKPLVCESGVWTGGSVTIGSPYYLVNSASNASQSYCFTMSNAAIVTTSAAGKLNTWVNGVLASRTAGIAGQFSDVATDISNTVLVPKGGQVCSTSTQMLYVDGTGFSMVATEIY